MGARPAQLARASMAHRRSSCCDAGPSHSHAPSAGPCDDCPFAKHRRDSEQPRQSAAVERQTKYSLPLWGASGVESAAVRPDRYRCHPAPPTEIVAVESPALVRGFCYAKTNRLASLVHKRPQKAALNRAYGNGSGLAMPVWTSKLS